MRFDRSALRTVPTSAWLVASITVVATSMVGYVEPDRVLGGVDRVAVGPIFVPPAPPELDEVPDPTPTGPAFGPLLPPDLTAHGHEHLVTYCLL